MKCVSKETKILKRFINVNEKTQIMHFLNKDLISDMI